MDFDPEKCQEYINQFNNLRRQLVGQPTVYTFNQLDTRLVSLFAEIDKNQPELSLLIQPFRDECVSGVSKVDVGMKTRVWMMHIEKKMASALDKILEVALDYMQQNAQQAAAPSQLKEWWMQAGTFPVRSLFDVPALPSAAQPAAASPTDEKQQAQATIKKLQEQFAAVTKERDKANADLARMQEVERKLSDKCNELRREHTERLSQLEQEQGAKRTEAQTQYRKHLLQAEREHSEQIASLRNEYIAAQDQLKGQISDLSQTLQGARNALNQARAEKDKAEQETAKIKEQAAGEIVSLQAQVAELQRHDERTPAELNPARSLAYVRQRQAEGMPGCPPSLVAFAAQLLAVADRLDAGDTAWLTSREGMETVHLCVYESPDPFAVLVQEGLTDMTIAPHLLAAQLELHQRLDETCLRLIRPSKGEPFSSRQHACAANDLIVVNHNPALHDTIVSVIRPGFCEAATQTVLRKAQVRRCVYMKSAEEDATGEAMTQG